LLSGAFLVRWRRRQASAAERQEIALGDARDALTALGDQITELDLDTEMPNADARGREEYDRAVELYERASRMLRDREPSDVELAEARRSLEEGRVQMAAARTALGSTAPRSS
jgi:hypothetical protein